eukprot:2555339-Rhodomonas_salina.4
MAPNLTAIAEDFGFTPEERDRKLGGDVAMVFFLVGGNNCPNAWHYDARATPSSAQSSSWGKRRASLLWYTLPRVCCAFLSADGGNSATSWSQSTGTWSFCAPSRVSSPPHEASRCAFDVVWHPRGAMNHKVAAELRFVGATGIAIGGAMPLIFSMLGDIFGIDRRAM